MLPGEFIDLTPVIGPGIYLFIDRTSGKGYYGESNLVAIRLGRHKKALEEGVHDNIALQ